ncbi:MAG: hypothetical protein ABIS35_13445, partial [Terracoccus sp.]
WDAERDPDNPDSGLVKWRTAAGRTYTTHPKDWLEHLRSPERRDPDGAVDPPGPASSHPDPHRPAQGGPPPF